MEENKEDCLSERTQAVLTILSAAMVLLAWTTDSLMAVFFAILSMIVIKAHAVKCYGRKMDKFYLIAYSIAALAALILEYKMRT